MLREFQSAGGTIEADGVRDLVRAAGVGGEDQRELAFLPRQPPQAHPRRGEAGNVFDALRVRLVEDSAGGFAVLERDRAREDAPIEFRQHDVHREIGRGQRARGFAPRLLGASRHRGLNDGAVRAVERRARILAARGKGGRVDDHVRRVAAELLAQPFRRAGGFEAGEVVGVDGNTEGISPHPVPLPMGEGTPLQRLRPAPSPMGRGLG